MFLKRIIRSLFLSSFICSCIYAADNQYSNQIAIYDKKLDVNDGGSFHYHNFVEDNFISKIWASIKKEIAESNIFLIITLFKLLLCLALILIWLLFAHQSKKINRLMILICISLAIISFINWIIILVSGLANSQKFFFLMKDSIILFSVYFVGIKVGQLILRYRINAEKVP